MALIDFPFEREAQTIKNCSSCRFWSEMLAMSRGNGVEAMCLSQTSPLSRKYTTERTRCDEWKDGYLGAIDSPGFDGTEYDDDH